MFAGKKLMNGERRGAATGAAEHWPGPDFGPSWPEVAARLIQYKNALLDKIQSGVLKIGMEIYKAVSGATGTTIWICFYFVVCWLNPAIMFP